MTTGPSLFMFCSEMADGTPSPNTASDSAATGEGEACARHIPEIKALGELIGIGLKIARAIERRVEEPCGEPRSLAELNAAAIAYARVARAVRQTILLRDALQGEQNASAAKTKDLRARVGRIVRRVIEAEHEDAEQVERLASEAAERLEQEDFDALPVRPIREIIADICKDLALHPDWPGLAEELAAVEEIARSILGGGGAPEAAVEDTGPWEVYWLDDEGRPIPALGPDSS